MLVSALALLGGVRLLWPRTDVTAQLAFVESALDAGADTAAQQQFPEGHLFLNALWGLASVQAGQLDDARIALRRIESDEGKAPFTESLRPAHGIFWAGWSNWLRANIVARDPDGLEAETFRAASAEIAAAFDASDTPFLPAYPGSAWPVDATVAIASIRLHDKVFGARFEPTVQRWLDRAKARLDPATGLLPHRDGAPGARATSAAMMAVFLPEIDAGFARDQYLKFRAAFVTHPLGFGPAVREYPRGTTGAGDVDSGPLVLGVSASATVVTLAAARANGDLALARALAGTGELIGVPVRTPHTKRYAFGAVPIADAFLVWAATTPERGTVESDLAWWWPLPWLTVLLAAGAGPWGLVYFSRKQRHAGTRT